MSSISGLLLNVIEIDSLGPDRKGLSCLVSFEETGETFCVELSGQISSKQFC